MAKKTDKPNILRRIANAAGLGRPLAPQGKITADRPQDSDRNYRLDDLKPERITALLKAADDGDLAGGLELFEDMEERDGHLASVFFQRRMALTGLDWRVVSAAEKQADRFDQTRADEAAAYCTETLSDLEGFDETLMHNATAFGRGLAVTELVWEGYKLRELVPVPSVRLMADYSKDKQVRVRTDRSPATGVPAEIGKWLTFMPHTQLGYPSRMTPIRAIARCYIAKHFSVTDWAVFAEIFGMPVRVATYREGATEKERKEIMRMLATLGGAAFGAFSDGVDVKFLETANRQVAPYRDLIEWADREMSKAAVGQTHTTDTSGQPGTSALGQVHNLVREDIRISDAKHEAAAIRRQVLAPIAQVRFGWDVPVPYFEREVSEPVDKHVLVNVLSGAANNLGLPIGQDFVYDSLGIPKPAENDTLVTPPENAGGLGALSGLFGGGN